MEQITALFTGSDVTRLRCPYGAPSVSVMRMSLLLAITDTVINI